MEFNQIVYSLLDIMDLYSDWTEHLIATDSTAFKLVRSDYVLQTFNYALDLFLFLLIGPFRVMMSTPAGLEEVIKYADFKKEATVEDVDDDSTLEDEPDEEDLRDIISGNITLNVSRIIILPDGELVRFLHSILNLNPTDLYTATDGYLKTFVVQVRTT